MNKCQPLIKLDIYSVEESVVECISNIFVGMDTGIQPLAVREIKSKAKEIDGRVRNTLSLNYPFFLNYQRSKCVDKISRQTTRPKIQINGELKSNVKLI